MEAFNKILLKAASAILLMLLPVAVNAQYMTELYLTDVNNDVAKTATKHQQTVDPVQYCLYRQRNRKL